MCLERRICLILRGSKKTSIGSQHEDLRFSDALLVSHDLPVVSQLTQAIALEPNLAPILLRDPRNLRSVYAQVADEAEQGAIARPLPCVSADPVWLAKSVRVWLAKSVRYVDLADDPRDARVLGPSFLREIHRDLLLSHFGQMLRPLLVADSNVSQVGPAIEKLRPQSARWSVVRN